MCLPSIYQFERTGTNLDHPNNPIYSFQTVRESNFPFWFIVFHSDPGDAFFSSRIPHCNFEAAAYFYARALSQDISLILSLLL